MELKISKIQWKKVVVFVLTLCMVITMVQLPVNAQGIDDEDVEVSRHLNVKSLASYQDTATFFDATANPDVTVTAMQMNKAYTVDSTQGAYDAKWFTFSPTHTGVYVFQGNEIGGEEVDDTVDSYGCLLEKDNDSYIYMKKNDDGGVGAHFSIKTELKAGKIYYLCAGFYRYSEQGQKYDVTVSEMTVGKITAAQTAKYITGSSDNMFSYTAEEDGYHTIKFSWKQTEDLYLDDYDYEIEDQDGNDIDKIYARQDDDAVFNCFYCEAGKTYYLIIDNFSFVLDDETTSNIEMTIGISKTKEGSVSLTKTDTYTSGSGIKLFKYIAESTGYHTLNLAWNNSSDMYLRYSDYKVVNDSGNNVTLSSAEKRDNSESYYFYCKEGRTYYIAINYMDFYNNTTSNPIDNVNVIISVAKKEPEELTIGQSQKYITGQNGKILKYVAESSGYHTLRFSWNCAQGTYLEDCDYNIKDENNKRVSSSTVDRKQNSRSLSFYCQQGKTYYINVNYFDFDNDEQEVESNIEVLIAIFKTDVVGTITYSQPANYVTDGSSRIYKFTAQYDGKHVLKAYWNRTDVYTDEWDDEVRDETGKNIGLEYITSENNAFYESFTCEKGKTYYINMKYIDAYLNNSDDSVSNVNVNLAVSYYGGKADIDTIKNTQPWIPGNENNKPNNPNNSVNPGNNTIGAQTSVKVSNITIAALSNKIAAGKKVQLTATVAPANASNKAVKWTTSNKKVAVVSQNGVVTVDKKAAGKSVIITAIAADGSGARATYKITVMKDAVKNIVVTGAKQTKAGKKIKLKAKVAAGKKANKKLVWSSSNPKFATVNNKGVVTTKKAGKGKSVKITAKSTDGSNKKKVFVIKIK